MTTEFQYITDVEGDLAYFKTQIRNSRIVRFTNAEENELEFISPEHTLFVSGGDICDAGCDITVTNMLVNFKEKNPERVILILGNRDGNKPRFSTELPLSPFESLNDTIDDVIKPAFTDKCRSFREFLEAKFKEVDESLNTPVNRLKWILEETMAAPRAFELRRQELARIENKLIVSDEEVYTSFRQSVEPGGFMRRYLSMVQIGAIIGDTIIAHGSILATNVGKVPNGFVAFEEKALASKSSLFQASGPDMLDVDDPHEWIEQLNSWYQSAFKRWVDTPCELSSYQFSNNAPSSPIQHIASGPGSKFISKTPVVGTFLKGRRTPWMIDEKAAQYLEKGNLKRVIVGHQPHGDTPLLIVGYPGEKISRTSTQVFTCDTFYGHKDAYDPDKGALIRSTDPRGSSYAIVHVSYDASDNTSVVHITGANGFDQPYERVIHFPRQSDEDRFLGRILKIDGEDHIVRINSRTTEEEKYILTYVKGQFAVTPKKVSRAYLEEMERLGSDVFYSTLLEGEFNIPKESLSSPLDNSEHEEALSQYLS